MSWKDPSRVNDDLGVLNVIGRAPHSPGDWPRYNRKAVHDGDWMAWPFCYSPDLMDLINLLVFLNHVQIRWLTTWEQDAYKSVAPQLGLRVGQLLGGIDCGAAEIGWWKLRVIQEHNAAVRGPFIWTEDEIKQNMHARLFVNALPDEAALIVMCDERKGLMPADVGSILDFLERRSTSSVWTS
jgi:hypothetical protein